MRLLEQLLFWAHGLSAAAWFGAIFYRTLVVDAKAFGYFPDRADYERFSTHLAHGMRYVVTAGLLTCGLSGFALLGLRWDGSNGAWLGLMAAKAGVWLRRAGCSRTCRGSTGRGGAWRRRTSSRRTAGRGCCWPRGWWLLAGTGFLLGQACRLTHPAVG